MSVLDDDAVRYERQDQIAIITFNRPQTRNAMSADVRLGMRERFAEFERDDAATVAILTGVGPSFCSGADLKELAGQTVNDTGRDYMPMLRRNLRVSKPVIAAVRGHAYGAGFLHVQMCDLVVASTDALFGMPEARWGRGAPWSIPLFGMIPKRIWMEIALTGLPITASRAYEIGLVNRVVEPADLMSEALELAGAVARGAPLTVRATRDIVHLASEMGTSAAWDMADRIFAGVYASADALEGPRAFAEHREPRWVGR